VVPCTDKCPSAESAGAAPISPTCAPAPPPSGSFAPLWFSGPYWPFNVAPTTLSISGLPQELTQDGFLEVLDREEFSGFYDFVFLPPAAASDKGTRNAIVNMTKHEYALALAARLHGKTSWGVGDGCDSCEVSWSLPLQGLSELIQVYRDSPESSPDVEAHLRPQLFSKGWPVPLPPPVPAAKQ